MSIDVQRFYLGCLAHASYLITSDGIAAVIDPQRDVDLYVEAASKAGVCIEHVILTHLHADFVSGHRELAERTGARIYIGASSGATFHHAPIRDNDSIEFGHARLQFLETPGHTLESVSIVLRDLAEPSTPPSVFTGDTLFIGDVGRPDLAPDHTPQQLAELLYQSLHNKLLTLPDETVIYPAHGAGSLCGRQMSSEASSTIGKQRTSNYALLARSSDEFVHLLTDHLPPRPEYFAREVELNRHGAAPLGELPELTPFSAPDVLRLQAEGAVVVDTRPAMQFAVAHVPGSLHIALTGQYASWAARILGLDTRLIIAGEDPEHVRESQLRLARVGVENVAGYLADGVAGWIKGGFELDYIPQISAQEFEELRAAEPGNIAVVDVREPAECETGSIEGSHNIPLGQLAQRISELDPTKLNVVHCKGGYRSSIASSLLRRAGLRDIANLTGGYDASADYTEGLMANAPAVLVAGGAGYIGSHTAKFLKNAGFLPVVLDNLCTGNRFALRYGPFHEGSISDAALIRQIVDKYQPQGAILFAGHIDVGESARAPRKYFHNNVSEAVHFLDALLDAGLNRVVFSSSCAVYGIQRKMPLSEDASKEPVSTYAETKLFLEKVLQAYGSAYGLKFAALRYFNASGADPEGEIGEHHAPESHLIPLAIHAALGGAPLRIFGEDYPTPDGTAVRDYIHVNDLADGHLRALRHLVGGGDSLALNLGTGSGYSVRQVIDTVERTSGKKVPAQRGPRREGDAPELVCDPRRVRETLGWIPQHSSLEEIVTTAWRWHNEYEKVALRNASAIIA